MKVMQIFWSKPAFDLVSIRYNGGWLERKYYYMSLCLSCLMLKQWHPELSLITDRRGKNLLIHQLGLPYNNVSTELEDFADCQSDFGMIVRLSCFQRQRAPFLCVDGDVYINEGLSPSIWKSNFIVQQETLLGKEEAGKLAELLKFMGKGQDPASGEPVRNYEQGVIGGNDLPKLTTYTKETLDFLYRNIDHIQKGVDSATRDSGNFSNTAHPFELAQTMIESYFLTSFLSRNAIRPFCAAPPAMGMNRNNNLLDKSRGQATVRASPLDKRKQEFCDQLEFVLQRRFPDQYFLILSQLREFRV
jgi:hypothetical protein